MLCNQSCVIVIATAHIPTVAHEMLWLNYFLFIGTVNLLQVKVYFPKVNSNKTCFDDIILFCNTNTMCQ